VGSIFIPVSYKEIFISFQPLITEISPMAEIGGWQGIQGQLEPPYNGNRAGGPRSLERSIFMKKFVALAFAATAALALTACGSADSAKDEAQADNVEIPAEETVGDIDATPAADASAGADAGAATKP
jgi:hypothetical protein